MQTEACTEQYSVTEEIVHAITHGVGALLSIGGLAVMIAFSVLYGNALLVTSVSIYGATLILLYTASTVYHSIPHPRAKPWLQQLDHASIYLLIAGTYTPFTLVSLQGPWGWTLFGLVWAMAITGVTMKMARIPHTEKFSLGLYLLMGWLVIIAIKPMLDSVETGGLILLLIGGLSYTFGAIFYAWDRLAFNHAIWHLFVLSGSIFHFFAILFYVIPDNPLLCN
jgi:hemolysin III